MTDPLLHNVTPPLGRERFAWSVGTRRIDVSDWLAFPADRAEILAEKRRLHDEQLASVVVSLPNQDDCGDELLELVVAALNHYGDGSQTVPQGTSIEVVGRLTVEDFAIMRKIGGSWCMTAASICFPSRWDLKSKLGRDLAGIHEPVPHYEDRLAAAVDAVFDRLTAGEVLARSNWTLLDTNTRHLPEIAADSSTGPLTHVRVERQSLRRLPESGAVTFGINTIIKPISDLSAGDRRALFDAVALAPADVRAYKGWPRD